MSKSRRKSHDCPNCGTALAPDFEYCPTCGQENHELKVPFRHMVYEFIEGIFHFDAKVWGTLKAMCTPGRITAEFLVGKRARYVPPVRLYIFVSVVFFFLLNALMNQRMHAASHGPRPAADTAQAAAAEAAPPDARNTEGDMVFSLSKEDRAWLLDHLDELTDAQLDSVNLSMGNRSSSWFKRRFLLSMLHVPDDDSAPAYIAAQTSRATSWLMFILMPFTALLLKVFFARKRLYYEHLIFSLHTHTVVFLLFSIDCIVGLLLRGTFPEVVLYITLVTIAVYLVLALRHVYRRSWSATLSLLVVMAVPYLAAFITLFLAGWLFGFLLH